MPTNVFTPRPYQIELVERALKRNTIACLNSTAAKSFVWMTYLREILGHNFAVAHDDGNEANAFVLFYSDHLVREYGLSLKTHLDMRVAALPTEKGLQLNLILWNDVLSTNKIIVTTPKVMASALLNSFFECSLVSVLIFDECQTVLKKGSDYRKIIQTFKEDDCKPYILGLTSSLLNEDSSASQLKDDIKLMEELLDCKAETATDLIALDGCSPSQPDEKIVLCGLSKIVSDAENSNILHPSKLSDDIRDILIPAIEWLKTCKINSNTGIKASEKTYSEKERDDCGNCVATQCNKEEKEDDAVPEDCEDANANKLSNCEKTEAVTPKTQPTLDINALVGTALTVLSQVLLVLDVLGLWCAHRLVILLLKQLQQTIRLQDSIDKCEDVPSKWKYLLLRYTDSHLRTVYTLCQTHLGNQKKVDLRLVTPKVDRLLQVLKEYKPPAEPDKKSENTKLSRYNDRSEVNYVSWWQDSDAEEDEEEEQMLNRGNEIKDNGWNEKEGEKKIGSTKTRQFHHANTLCGIVFVKEKYVALMLQRLLREVSKEDSDLWHISSAHITSLATTETTSNILEKENVTQDMYNNTTNTEKLKREEVLRSFRSHEINVLVSTNCMEEYAEIPKCNLVLRFNVPTTYKSYILSKSRVRSTNSTYMMLVHEGEKADFMLRLQEYKKIEKVLQDSTYELQSKKTAPADFDYFDVKEGDSDDEYERARAPPYYSGPTTCVTLDSAIHVINRYCSRLPSDPFTHLSPRCEVVEVSNDNDRLYTASLDKAYQGILQLPINAHVCNPIRGVSMSTVLLAQKAVALEACKVLHKAGELDDHFMPIGKEMVKYAEELDSWPAEKALVPGRPGTTKRRQTYEKEVPATLSDCLPRADISLFLYEIEMKLKTRLPDGLNVRRRQLHAPEETTRCFGILTAKPLPPILGFPIFTRSGEESVQIRLCRSFISLGEHHIKMVRSFHHYIFSDMLRIDRVPLTFRPGVSQMQIFVVILDKPNPAFDLDIDWRFMCEVATKRRIDDRMRTDPWFRHRLLESKGGKNAFVFDRSKYEDGVVVAKYRSPDQPNRFYVAEIKDELTPYSSFPSSEYESFHHYYRIKYGLDISCLNQPLLDVDHTSSRLNLLTPRYMNQRGKVLPVSSLEKKRAKYETLTNRQILVPELCELHPIPASLWRKAVCIPSVLYRLSSVLLAEELRQKIYEESGLGQKELPLGCNWPDLDFGWENDQSEDGESIINESDSSNRFNYNDAVGDLVSKVEDIQHNETSHEKPESNGKGEDEMAGCELIAEDMSNHDPEEEHCVEQGVEVSDTVTKSTENGDKGKDTDVSDSNFDFDYESDEFQTYFGISGNDESVNKHRSKKNRKSRPAGIEKFTLAVLPREILENISKADESTTETGSVGPSPGLILQALTLSNASDGFNLERLEMLGDSFLKHAVTLYLFCTYPDAHEGKLSYMRSKKVSNYNLYRIGQQHKLPEKMTALIFDPAVNWLPPGYVIGTGDPSCDDDYVYKDSTCESLDDEMEIGVWTGVPGQKTSTPQPEKAPEKPQHAESQTSAPQQDEGPANAAEVEDEEEIFDEEEIQMIDNMLGGCLIGGVNGFRGNSHDRRNNGFSTFTGRFIDRNVIVHSETQKRRGQDEFVIDTWTPVGADGRPLCATDPLLIELHTQHSLADKSVADCVESILGAYLTTCGQRAAQILLCYFGLKVLPRLPQKQQTPRVPAYGFLEPPTNVLLDKTTSGNRKLDLFTKDLTAFEKKINYTFKNKAYLLQAFTHASYYLNTITDCYQRLEFLGDAILDYLITCRLFSDPARRHSPGALTDLRSALVNNTIFASLAVRHDFHKYFKAVSLEMHQIIDGFVRYQHLQEEAQGMDAQLAKKYYPTIADSGINDLEDIIVAPDAFMDLDDGEEEEEEDVEVPKALGDIFESVAGAIYMDSGMDLDEVWRVYEPMMGPLIEKFSSCVPRAPVRELLEMEPETVKFSWAEKRCDGKVRVTVEVIGKGSFKGVGRSYRIAKSAAARRALRFLKSQDDD